MPGQTFRQRVVQMAIAYARAYEEVFLEYEYLVCSKVFVENTYHIIAAHTENYRHLIGARLLKVRCSFATTDRSVTVDFTTAGESRPRIK